MKFLAPSLCALTIFLIPSLHAGEQWIELFNGRDLEGWEQKGGGAKYSVQDGVIVGESVNNTPNSFLCTTRTFGNFELELEFRCDPALNSGVQIRSECLPEKTAVSVDGQPHEIPANRVHGYQCEIDMDGNRGRFWTGGIYDEGRRGWLFPKSAADPAGKAFTDQGARISHPNDWNKLRIVADGPSIKTWLNGELRADLTDAATARGFIALQVHDVGSDPAAAGRKVFFRNIRLREREGANAAARPGKWEMLWDGKTSEGWRSARSEEFPTRGWTMKNGVLTVQANDGEESGGGGDIITRKRYANFELEGDFRITPGANSGIKIFTQPNLSPIDKKTGRPVAVGSAIGLEFQILDDARHPDAKLGKNGNRKLGSLYDLIPAPSGKTQKPVGDWNHVRIVSRGRHVEFYLNGRKTVEFERGSPEFRELVAGSKYRAIPEFGEWPDGHILLQDHGNEVSFRNLRIRELPAGEN